MYALTMFVPIFLLATLVTLANHIKSTHATWTLVTQTGETVNSNLQKILTTQANNTGTQVATSGGTQVEYFLKQVVGTATSGPAWASWLTPLSFSNGSTAYVWPSSGFTQIPSHKTYQYGYKYSSETGSQDWESATEAPYDASRTRSWKTIISEIEIIY